jgi:hypothetical protein
MKYILLIFIFISCGGNLDIKGSASSSSPPVDPTDQFSSKLVQSVGTQATALLSSGQSLLSITGNIANFSTYKTSDIASLSLGIGDVIVYGSNYAMIKGITHNSKGFKAYVTLKDGSSPPVATAGSSFSIYRAFNSLADWNTQTQNSNISPNISLSDLDLTDSDDEDGPLIASLYNDSSLGNLTVSGWTTDASAYLHLYVPYKDTESSSRQRHQGVWSTQYTHLNAVSTNGVSLSEAHVRIEGLQCHITTSTGNRCIYSENNAFSGAVFYFSHNILRGANDAGNSSGWHSGVQMFNIGDGEVYIYNNIIYDFISSGSYPNGVDFDDGDYTGVFANNTVYNNTNGMWNFNGSSIKAYNNIVVENTTDYLGSWHADSSHNISSQTNAPGTSIQNSVTIEFRDKANRDLRLDSTQDTEAIDAGVSMASHADLPFSTDGIMQTRGSTWDMGAVEAQ